MDKYLKYKQIFFKIGIPLLFIVVLILVIFSGIDTKQNPQINNKEAHLSLFKEDELVATRYTDSIEDKLNIAVSSQDNIKSENEKIKKELDALQQYIIKKEEKDKNNQIKNDNLYNSFPNPNPNIPDLIGNDIQNNFTQKVCGSEIKQTKILYKVMEQSDSNKTSVIDPNFGKVEKKIMKA